MKKSDLKTGMRVETRNRNLYLVLRDCETSYYGHQDFVFANLHQNDFLISESYNEDLFHEKDCV